jgi:hypothetical protein
MTYLHSNSEKEKNLPSEYVSGATLETFLKPYANARMSNIATTIAKKRISVSTSINALLRPMENYRQTMMMTSLKTLRRDWLVSATSVTLAT